MPFRGDRICVPIIAIWLLSVRGRWRERDAAHQACYVVDAGVREETGYCRTKRKRNAVAFGHPSTVRGSQCVKSVSGATVLSTSSYTFTNVKICCDVTSSRRQLRKNECRHTGEFHGSSVSRPYMRDRSYKRAQLSVSSRKLHYPVNNVNKNKTPKIDPEPSKG